AFLSIQSVTITATKAGELVSGGFVVAAKDHILECSPDSLPGDCIPDTGFISAVVMSFVQPVELPLGRNSLCKARYQAKPAFFDARQSFSTTIAFSEQLRLPNSPTVTINITVNGRSRQPRTVIDGSLTSSKHLFHRGDPSANGRIDVSDAVL